MLAPIQQVPSRPIPGGVLPRFVVTLDARLTPGDSLVRVPLAMTGRWVRGASEFAITLQDLGEIVGNFQGRQNEEINVDYDHASEMPEVAAGGPIPSAGRIVKLDPPEMTAGRGGSRTAPTYMLWGWYEPTERARQLIQKREYRFISPAIDWTARHKRTGKPQGTTLTSVALTNRPFLEEMPQIRLSDPAYQLVGEASGLPGDGGAVPCFQAIEPNPPRTETHDTGGPMKQVTLSVADGKIKIAHEDLQDEFFLDPEDLRKCMEELGLLSEANLASTLHPLATRQKITLTQAGALFSEAEARGKSIPAEEFFRAQVDRELEEAVKAGKVLPRRRDDWRKIALSDFSTFRKLLAEQKPQVPLRPIGFASASPEDVRAQVKFLAEQRMRERNMAFGQALSEISREQPDLMQQYRRAVSGTES